MEGLLKKSCVWQVEYAALKVFNQEIQEVKDSEATVVKEQEMAGSLSFAPAPTSALFSSQRLQGFPNRELCSSYSSSSTSTLSSWSSLHLVPAGQGRICPFRWDCPAVNFVFPTCTYHGGRINQHLGGLSCPFLRPAGLA